jgi:hypothetical protein
MPATAQDITHYLGDSLAIQLGPVLDADGGFADLAGATARWWMAKSVTATGTDIYVQKSGGNGLVLDGNTAGEWIVMITLDPSDTEDLKAGKFYHECEVVDSSGNVSTVTVGKFTLLPTLIPNA